jgi:hypothetical protein
MEYAKFSVQRRSTHFQVTRRTGQVALMQADRLDDQFHFDPSMRRS